MVEENFLKIPNFFSNSEIPRPIGVIKKNDNSDQSFIMHRPQIKPGLLFFIPFSPASPVPSPQGFFFLFGGVGFDLSHISF
jgi:hypothetical protein